MVKGNFLLKWMRVIPITNKQVYVCTTQVVYLLSTFDIHKWKKVISTQANLTLLSVFGAVKSEKIQEKHPHMLKILLRELAKTKELIDFLSGFWTYKTC